ncbi:MAG: preprotein translocase subunit YajC [Clostridia bacterium]|nr:preprotein translocase subunit YajC [Clostridia bacterium]
MIYSTLRFLADEAPVEQPTGVGSWYYIIMMVVFFALIYFMMIRPEKKRNKQLQDMRNSLIVGDKITTNGGIVGTVVNIKEDEITIESGIDGTKMLIKKWAIATIDTIKS